MPQSTDAETMTEPAQPTTQPKPRWQAWALRVAIGVAIFAALLVATEVVLRVANVGYSTELLTSCTIAGKPASCYNLFFPAPFFPPGMIRTPQVYAIPAEKTASTYRIFVLGESAAMGDPDPAYAFSRYLEVMLRERYPAMKFEVVNTGSVAINSHVLLPMARELAKQKPDAFILYSGNNEVVGPYGPGTALTSSGMSMPVIRSSIFLRGTRIGQLLTQVGEQKKEWTGMEMFLDKQVPASSPLMPYAYANFETNLRETVDAARASGALVIVATIATNLKDCAPFASMHREGLSPDELKQWNTLMQQGIEAENNHAYADALQAYTAAAKIDNQYAELEFRIARMLWISGDYVGAKQYFARARDLDSLRFRADSRINDINRSVAKKTGADLLDAEELLSGESANGVIGSDMVYEHVHLTPRGNYLMARAIYYKIAQRIDAAAGQTAQVQEPPSQAECEQLLAFTPHDHNRINNEMLQRLQRPPFTNQINHNEQVMRLTMLADAPPENPNDTVAQYQWAISRKPGDRVLHYNFGLFLYDFNQQAGVQQLLLARPWDGFPVFTPDGRMVQ